MNGDTTGTMGEPGDLTVPNVQDSMPKPKKLNSNSEDVTVSNSNSENETSCKNSNSTDELNIQDSEKLKVMNSNEGLDESQDKVNNKGGSPKTSMNNSDSVLEDLQDKDTSNTDMIKANSLDSEVHNNKDEESQKSSEDTTKCVREIKYIDSEEMQAKKELLSDEIDDSDYLEESNDLDSNNTDDPIQLSKQEDCHVLSEDESSEDAVGGTKPNGDIDSKQEEKIHFQIVAIEKHHSDVTEHLHVESIISSDYSGSEGEPRAEDTVSIESDSENSHHAGDHSISDDIIILENDGTDCQNSSKTPEVHEILSDNDDCEISDTDKINPKSAKKTSKKGTNNSKVELRRSSRSVKRRKYDDDIEVLDESDVEEVILEDPLKRKSKPVVLSGTKKLMEMAAKHMTTNINQKKDTVVIIDSPVSTTSSTPSTNKTVNSSLNQSIYQTIVSRGTSVTPVSSKNTATQSTQACQTPSPPLLPTLTDDMFVVEAPSFIVPYVYEKPAQVPFKEFVDKLGKELEEEKAKEEQALLEKKKEEKAKRDQERKEKKERGEEVEESEEEVDPEQAKKKKAEKKEKRRRKKAEDEDDVSWDGSSSEESEDDTISDDDNPTDKSAVIEEVKDITDLTADPTGKSNSYFDLFLGKFFMNIGLNLVQEYVQTDLLKQQNRKLQREKKANANTKNREVSISLLRKNLELSQKNNVSFKFELKKCVLCTFKTESALAMAHHLETPHMNNNLYKCNECTYEIRSPHDILYHMETKHGVKGRLERSPSLHQCANCPFEDHGKGKLARHLTACAKKFKPETNLAPPLDWEHPAKIPKLTRARNNVAPYQVAQFGRHHVDSNSFTKLPIPIANAMPPLSYRQRRPTPRGALPVTPIPVHVRAGGLVLRQCAPMQTNYPIGKKSMHPSISITPLPRQPVPAPVQPLHTTNAKDFVICEICDGYIKDLEQLRNHMQWIHKVKIHPKMIYNRPPLNCQKCQFRFFTDQGLERHLLGSHGLVTSAMQEAANKGKDAGRCPVCGRVYQWKLLNHVSRDHSLILKPAHLSYKCTVCTATFGMYRQFENHVYSAHSVVAKKVMDKKTTVATAKATANDNAAKQLKINDEITIIPQPVKVPGPEEGK